MAWAPPIWIYLWLAGMAGGGYFAAYLIERYTKTPDNKLLRLATYLGVPMAVIGVLLLIIDLGAPLRFWHLFTQFKLTSPMSAGTWILLLWVIIAVVLIMLWWLSNKLSEATAASIKKLTAILIPVDFILSILLIAYTGVLLSVSNQPMWSSTILIPALFVASAVSTGIAILIIAAIASNAIGKGNMVEMRMVMNFLFGTEDWMLKDSAIEKLAEMDVVVIVIELLTLIGYVIWLAVSSMVGAGEALALLTTGTLAAPFWVGVVLLALLIPLGLELANWGKDITRKTVSRAIIASSVCVVLGGLVLRAVITIGGQM
jgi:formate-dependent nitrite reductase membrane component NrfD